MRLHGVLQQIFTNPGLNQQHYRQCQRTQCLLAMASQDRHLGINSLCPPWLFSESSFLFLLGAIPTSL